jgi:hypothetical protein
MKGGEQMDGTGDRRLRVGQDEYILDGSTDVAAVVQQIEQALTNKTVAKIAVLDDKRNAMTLYLNGGQVDVVVINADGRQKPGEIWP